MYDFELELDDSDSASEPGSDDDSDSDDDPRSEWEEADALRDDLRSTSVIQTAGGRCEGVIGGGVRNIPFRPLLGSFVALFLSLLLLGRQDPIRSSTPERVFYYYYYHHHQRIS